MTVRILAIEDNLSDLHFFKEKMLSSTVPMDVEHVDTFEGTVRMLAGTCKCSQFDVMLLDIHLPNGEGVELVRRARGLCKNIALVVLTGMDDEPIERYFEAGADDFIAKSSEPRQVRAVILAAYHRVVRRRAQNREWKTLTQGMYRLEKRTSDLLTRRVSGMTNIPVGASDG